MQYNDCEVISTLDWHICLTFWCSFCLFANVLEVVNVGE